jgi:hypothetical protein
MHSNWFFGVTELMKHPDGFLSRVFLRNGRGGLIDRPLATDNFQFFI